jgi:hypothetical protein
MKVALVVTLGLVGAVSFATEPLIQSHTEDPSIFARALLQQYGPHDGPGVTGNLEFQARADGTRLLIALAGGDAGKRYRLELMDTNRCPGQDKKLPAPKKLGELARIEVQKDGMAASTRKLRDADAPGGNWKNVVQKASVWVLGGKSDTVVACGPLESTGPSDRREPSQEAVSE